MYRYLLSSVQKNIKKSVTQVQIVQNYHTENVYGHKKQEKSAFEISAEDLENRRKDSNFYRLVSAYRQHGHKIAKVNPVAYKAREEHLPELEVGRYGLEPSTIVNYDGILQVPGRHDGTVQEALDHLNQVYTDTLAAEFMHLEEEEEREWFSGRMERSTEDELEDECRIRTALELLRCQTFDKFLANKFTGLKRYGGEGAEGMMAFFSEALAVAAQEGLQEVVIGMPHRGRLNLLTGLLDLPPQKLFRKLKGLPDFPDKFKATGDVISHLISSADLTFDEKKVHVSVLYNPSHLEAVNPLSMGKTRAKQMARGEGDYGQSQSRFGDAILNIQVHGDAAYIAQGIDAECLNLSRAPHFEIGGTVHLIVNNQVGFTTPAERGRSSRYCTDLAKVISAPVLHVNGDHPEMITIATRIALDYQRRFRKDVFIDLNCYRQWGHNELDDPTVTNPKLYGIIHSRKTVPDLYADKLIEAGILTKQEVEGTIKNHTDWLLSCLKSAESWQPEEPCFTRQWSGFEQAPNAITTWGTGVDPALLVHVANKSVEYPRDFNIHLHVLKTHVQARKKRVAEGNRIDWSTAESMAFGSLLYEGYNVRLSGQDVGRGTFAQRHAMLVDQEENSTYIPLNHMDPDQKGFLEVANSILSEEAVLGFEYGMSVESPKNLIIWEAQFGDFFNGAQIILDTCVSSGEAKWLWSSGITLLLPHGYDGAGPEHSSCRPERFLQLSDSRENQVDGDDVNMHVVHPSTPAQYFHLLRRQMVRNYRKPLIVLAPKTLLRLSSAVSSLEEMSPGTSFRPVLGDQLAARAGHQVRKVVLCSGKHYYNLAERRESLGLQDLALVRVEQLCPFPTHELMEEVTKYPQAKCFIWSQEEPRNMGAWTFIKPRFENLIGKRLRYTGRETLPTPAVGVGKWHQEQAADVIDQPFHLKLNT